jgi:hypothetical protein
MGYTAARERRNRSREGDGSVEGPSPKTDLVTETQGTPHFRASSSDVTNALRE